MKFTKGFVVGISKIFDLHGEQKRDYVVDNGSDIDLEALKGDWYNVGKTIEKCTKKFASEKR